MIYNYFLIAIRNLKKNLLHSFINITGLGLGIAAVIMIFSYVRYELSFDRHFPEYERIYRISLSFPEGELERTIATNYPIVHRTFPSEFPGIKTSTRLFNAQFSGSKNYIRVENAVFPNQIIYYGDSTFFDVFRFQLISGNPAKALSGEGKAVITQEAALKYFGTTDCLGKRIDLNDTEEFMISGVMESIPVNTHFHFDVLFTMENHYWEKMSEWNGLVFATYFLLHDGIDPELLSTQIGDYLVKIRGSGDPEQARYLRRLMPLMPLSDIHLHSHMEMELEANSDSKYVLLFSSIAIFILLIACINYINLATSRNLDRAREVGLRKIFGAYRSNLVIQFLGESLIISLIAFILALGMVEIFRPFFVRLINIQVTYGFFFENYTWLLYLLFIIGLGMIAGLYPALFLSRFMPGEVIKGKFSRSPGSAKIRKTLVVFQFIISVFLIVGSLVVFEQLDYMLSKDLGIDKQNIVAIPFFNEEMIRKSETIKAKIKEHHSVVNGTAVSQLPINISFTEGVSDNMTYNPEDVEMFFLHADTDFFQTMGIDLLKGKLFTREYSQDYTEYIVNNAGVQALGEDLQSIFDRQIRVKHPGITLGPIIGVIEDFNFASLHDLVGPLVISQNPSRYQYLLFKIEPGVPTETLSHMKNSLKEIVPDVPFEFQFMDQEFDNLYKSEIKLSNIVIVFTILAIFIACIGLFGLSAYDTMQRTKEIGIRKVMGSTILQIVVLFISENIRLIIISLILALPLSYVLMNLWLQEFAFRIRIGFPIIVSASIFIMVITLITITYHALRAAVVNPSDTLRYE